MSEVEKNIRMIELGYKASQQGLDLENIKEKIYRLHGF